MWLGLLLVAVGLGVLCAIAAAVRRSRGPNAGGGGNATGRRGERLDRRVAHYRASGVLPRWDP